MCQSEAHLHVADNCHGWGRRWETTEERTGVEASDADADAPLMYIFQIDWASPLLSLFCSHSPTSPPLSDQRPCVKDRHRKTIDRLMWRVWFVLRAARDRVRACIVVPRVEVTTPIFVVPMRSRRFVASTWQNLSSRRELDARLRRSFSYRLIPPYLLASSFPPLSFATAVAHGSCS